MQSLFQYITQDPNLTNEGIIKDTISLAMLKNISGDKLRTGILSMYDFIVDEENMDLFYQDYPSAEKPLWKNLYELYTKKVWSIIDLEDSSDGPMNLPQNLTKVTPEVRRDIRKWIKNSRNNKLDLKPGEIDQFMQVNDNEKTYLITINRTTGFFRRLLRSADKRFLEVAFNQLNM